MTPFTSLLLLGPTASGKTPLGELLQARGFSDRRCLHFDFGENLRQAVDRRQADDVLSRDDLEFLRNVLRTGVLLEDKDFPIAERVLRSFLVRNAADGDTLLVLNGLPRHVAQAEALRDMVDVQTVVALVCSPEVVLRRITADTGGDRAGRTDDQQADVRRKLATYARRTAPLVEFYQKHGARIVEVSVSAEMTAEQMWRRMDG